jgi:uncharacterized SAM-binding protein YcdF (DUF218 family)
MARRRIVITALPFLVFGITLFLFRKPILLAVGDFLVVRDELQPTDVIHVLAGPDEQTHYAIRLYRQGFGKKIFFTGGWCVFHNFYHGQHGKELALRWGIPPTAIAIDESPVTSTYGEVVRLQEFIDHSAEPVQSVITVSDPYHMRRAGWTYRQVLGDKIQLHMGPVPFELSPHKHYWWKDKGSRRMVRDEYEKIVYYYARYRFSWGPLKDLLASLERD